jgi:hypothetical protein
VTLLHDASVERLITHCYWCSLSFLAHLPTIRPYKSEATRPVDTVTPYQAKAVIEHDI